MFKALPLPGVLYKQWVVILSPPSDSTNLPHEMHGNSDGSTRLEVTHCPPESGFKENELVKDALALRGDTPLVHEDNRICYIIGFCRIG